jgi:uncharacterized protein YacL
LFTNDEQRFYDFWEANRLKTKQRFRYLIIGIPIGLIIGIALLSLLLSGWYERANMVANSQANPMVLLIAIIIITAFMAYFYQNFKWEKNEQLYQELKARKEKEEKQIK